MDNAIESSKKVADPDKRIIKMMLYTQNGLLIIRFENYYESSIKIIDGEFATTKHDKTGHGYGIKNIKRAAAKYNGTVKINTDNNWFSLCVLIPLS